MTTKPELSDYRADVERRRSRWAFCWRMTIPCENGLVYLVRLRVIQTPLFGIYLHDIHEPDGDRDPHNHPWSFLSLVLRGHYVERLYPSPASAPALFVQKRWRRLSLHRMGRHSAHRIVEAGPRLKTLIFVGPRAAEGWGFFERGRFVPWQEYKGLL